jgi:hypothetical protein
MLPTTCYCAVGYLKPVDPTDSLLLFCSFAPPPSIFICYNRINTVQTSTNRFSPTTFFHHLNSHRFLVNHLYRDLFLSFHKLSRIHLQPWSLTTSPPLPSGTPRSRSTQLPMVAQFPTLKSIRGSATMARFCSRTST